MIREMNEVNGCRVDVDCTNCHISFPYYCEWEDAGEGSEHKKECFICNSMVTFEIGYNPSAGNEVIENE